MRIGIMGGTFDPIHIGHLVAAESAKTGAGLDEIWLMPTFAPPHKEHAPRFSPEQRLAMAELAVQGVDDYRVCPLEMELGGTSYTADTVKELTRRYPEREFYWIIGADMVQYLPHWHKIDDIAAAIRFIGLERPGFGLEPAELPESIRRSVRIVPMPRLEISSTDIRRRIDEGESIRFLVPEAVRAYVERIAKQGGKSR